MAEAYCINDTCHKTYSYGYGAAAKGTSHPRRNLFFFFQWLSFCAALLRYNNAVHWLAVLSSVHRSSLDRAFPGLSPEFCVTSSVTQNDCERKPGPLDVGMSNI